MEFVSDLEPYLVRRWLAGDDAVLAELAGGFWDRQYVRKFGLPRIPDVVWPIPLGPDPSPEIQLTLQNDVMANVLGWLAGDPEPEPNRPPPLQGRNLIAALSSPDLKLKAATDLRARTLRLLQSLDAEIAALSSTCAP